MEKAQLNGSLCLQLKELDWAKATVVFEKKFSPWTGVFKKRKKNEIMTSCFFSPLILSVSADVCYCSD